MRAAIPIDVELERARKMVREITPELRSNVRLIVNEEIAVKSLRNEIAAATDKRSATARNYPVQDRLIV